MEGAGQVVEDFNGADIHKNAEGKGVLWYEAVQWPLCADVAFFATMNCKEITFRNKNIG
jgi:hypothetical protein